MFTKLSNLQWRQILTTASVNYIMVCVGMSLVWTSPVLRELRGPDSPLTRPPTSEEQGWMGSLILLGGFFGPILTVPLTRVIGRRWIILTMGIPHILGWAVAGVATTIYHMCAARFLWGCTLGISFMMVPIYVGEIAEDSIRGALGAMFSQALNMGFFMGYFVGRFTNYWGLAATGGVLSLFYLVLAWTLPETPLYLVYKGHSAEASVVLQKLRNASEEAVSAELKSLETAVESEYKNQPKISDLWASRGSLKALAICVFLSVMIQLSGINVLLFYLEELFAKIKVGMSPADASILIGVVQTISSSITPFIIERLGRRLLLYTTLFGMAIALSMIGIYTVMESYYNHDMTSFAFLPVLCIIVYIILFSSGIGPMPPILISEMFRPKVKCLASAICSSCNWIAGFILTRFYTNLTDAGGTYTGFWMLAVFCTIGSLFSFLFLSETKGKSFDEIQDLLENRTSDKKTGE